MLTKKYKIDFTIYCGFKPNQSKKLESTLLFIDLNYYSKLNWSVRLEPKWFINELVKFDIKSINEKNNFNNLWNIIVFKDSSESLDEIAFEQNINLKSDDVHKKYLTIEREILNKRIKIPYLEGGGFSPSTATWYLILINICLLILIDNRLKFVVDDNNFGAGEPWMILDAITFAERFFARTWQIIIMLCPWLSASFIIYIITTRNRASGISSLGFNEIFISILLILIIVVGHVKAISILKSIRIIKIHRLNI
jgi:hypothetical protein